MIAFAAWAWLGVVVGVSFVATPAKFTAKSLTLPVALDVGRATFHISSRIEWLLSALLIGLAVAAGLDDSLQPVDVALVAIVVAMVALQSAWLLPTLDERVAAIIDGRDLPPSWLHRVFAASELAKVAALALVGASTAGHV